MNAPPMKVIWILVGLVSLFAGGVAAGILYHHHMHLHGEGHPAHGHDAAHFVDHFRKRLDLNHEQATEVKDILNRLHKEMEGLSSNFHDRFTALRSRAWTDIRTMLNEAQRSEFDKLVDELEKKHPHH